LTKFPSLNRIHLSLNKSRIEFQILLKFHWKMVLFIQASKWPGSTGARQAMAQLSKPMLRPLAGPCRPGMARACAHRGRARPGRGTWCGEFWLDDGENPSILEGKWTRSFGLRTATQGPETGGQDQGPHRRGLGGGGKWWRRGRRPARKRRKAPRLGSSAARESMGHEATDWALGRR
jgi:hypothetical protein